MKGSEQELDQLLPHTVEDAKIRLKEGNQRFINGNVTGFFEDIALSLDAARQAQNIDCMETSPTFSDARKMVAASRSRYSPRFSTWIHIDQKPWACVVACSDSRVAPEVIFDTGLRDLFVTRVAGNLADPLVLGSLEYAVTRFKKSVSVQDEATGQQKMITDGSVKLIVVLGHQECGAIKAASDALDHVRRQNFFWLSDLANFGLTSIIFLITFQPGHVQGNVGELVKQVFDSVNKAKSADDIAYDFLTYGAAPPRHLTYRDKAVQRAVYYNVQNVMADLEEKSQTIRQARKEGKIEIVGYIFDLDSRHLIKVPHKIDWVNYNKRRKVERKVELIWLAKEALQLFAHCCMSISGESKSKLKEYGRH